AFRCIRDGKTVFHSPGTGQLQQAVFAVFGKELSRNLIPIVPTEMEGIRVYGFLSKPHSPRANRSYQHFFVNGRFVKSRLIQAAMEEAYRNAIITGKFPYGCLCIDLPLSQVDVNVHPAKVEVKFAFEKKVFSAVYAACKNTLAGEENVPEIQADTIKVKTMPPPAAPKTSPAPDKPVQRDAVSRPRPAARLEPISIEPSLSSSGTLAAQTPYRAAPSASAVKSVPENRSRRTFRPFIDVDAEDERALSQPGGEHKLDMPMPDGMESEKKTEPLQESMTLMPDVPDETEDAGTAEETLLTQARPTARVIGSCFATYLLAEDADGLILIDKHAAHERIIFNELRKSADIPTQMLLEPVVVELTGEEFAVMSENQSLVQSAGFHMEPFGRHSMAVREAPAYLEAADIPATVSELAQKLMDRLIPVPDQLDHLIHTVSCKAAIKAGWDTSMAELQSICDRVLSDPEVNCCPHGRPVMVRLTKYELDKLFKRVNQ
ncbi:MAG: DNA mismatch repair endonuclease MutL, partial [Butyricicoccus sp.]